MKTKLLFSMLLLFVGVSMQAQSIANEQMDERFNDGTKMPCSWCAESWKVDDGKAKAKATTNSGNNGMPGMGGGGGNPGTSDNPMGGMGNMFGGDRIRTYMLTPPVVAENDDKLVFCVRKTNGDDNGMGFNFDMKAIMGMTDTIFAVERSVYGKNQWVRVGDYTTILTMPTSVAVGSTCITSATAMLTGPIRIPISPPTRFTSLHPSRAFTS